MKRTYLACLILAGALLTTGATRAGIIEDFNFNEAVDTPLNMTANDASSHMWVHDTDHAATIQVLGGTGSLNIVKNNTDFVTEGLAFDDVSSGVLWVVADFANWALLGTAPNGTNVEEIRFGLMATEDISPPPSSTVLAEMWLSRDFSTDTLEIQGVATSSTTTVSTDIAGVPVNNIQTQPFTMAMKVDQDTDTYSIFYKDGANPFVKVGDGLLEPSRDALVVRFTVNNFWGDETGEFANLDRFYIADEPPIGIPEPTSVLLIAIAAGCIGLVRQR